MGALPEQVSATSQGPAAERHIVIATLKVSAGHSAADPSHNSASSHAPAEVRHGVFAGSRSAAGAIAHHHGSMAIIGYGTLGAGELGYDSDLDIVFLFESGGGESDGPRPLPAERYYARLAQRVLSFLTVMTPSGRLYE